MLHAEHHRRRRGPVAVAVAGGLAVVLGLAAPVSAHTGDPTRNNALSRSSETVGTDDPTSPADAERNALSAAAQRRQREPRLRHVPVDPPRRQVPQNRYAMYDACYTVQSATTGRYLTDPAAPSFTAVGRAATTKVYFKPTALGRYMLYSPASHYLDAGGADARWVPTMSEHADWTATMRPGRRFLLTVPGRGTLTVGSGGRARIGAGSPLRLRLARGCTAFPEIGTQVYGKPIAGVTPYQETRGFIDAHTHGMAFEFLGGDVHCGKPWSPYGVVVALTDCPDHVATGGRGAAMEAFLSGKPYHDPVGWPTFRDWPAPHSLTHEGTYYKWIERAWRGGQRMLVNLLVENNQLCQLYPIKHNSCDDMDSIRLQAKDMRAFEDYIDAQHGGPGKGWYRIVTTPDQARRVINAGKMAVVMGIETSVPFGCHVKLGVPSCNDADIDRQLDEVRRLGVTQMELVNKFDNALAGVAGDEGNTGYLVNTANTLETGSPWHMQTCNPNDPEVHDKDQDNSAPVPNQDALFGAVVKESGAVTLPAIPIYPPKHHCNTVGLSALGQHTITGMAQRHMLFDPDHMSVKARKASLDLIERLGYQGVVSSHSWSTPDAYVRIYRDGGFITPYAGDSASFVEKWQYHLTWANPKTYWGFGFGADINGLGAQGNPRPGAAVNPVHYPFRTLGGVRVGKQVSGQRVYDINRDGVAHYGLYPDWIQDLRVQAGGDIVKDLARGPEAYLQMWERAYGVRGNACTNPENRLAPRALKQRLHRGLTPWQTLTRAGQPDRRLGHTFSYCTTARRVTVRFGRGGRISRVL